MIISEQIPQNDSLVLLVEDYIVDATSKKRKVDLTIYRQRLKKLRKSPEVIEDILFDLILEVEKEEMALQKEVNAKYLFIGGLFGGIVMMILTVLSALKLILNGAVSYIMFGAIASSFLASMKGYNDLKDRKRRKKIRAIFWEDKYN